jgi:ribonuclease HI
MLIREGKEDHTLKVYLGPDTEPEVYEAEVLGLQLGLHLLALEQFVSSMTFFIDNQAVLKTIQSGRAKLIPLTFVNLSTLLNRVLQEHKWIRIDTRWIPGHEGVDGNEKADEAAKDVGENGSSAPEDLPKHLRGRIPTNPTAVKRVCREGMEKRWKEEVRDSPRTERMENLDPTYPSLQFFKHARNLTRIHFTTLVQLRLEHFPTATYLYRFKLADSPDCPKCGLRTQSPFHIVIGCKAHTEEQLERDRTLGAASQSYKVLLAPSEATPHLMRYLSEVGMMKGMGRGGGREGGGSQRRAGGQQR